MLSKVMNKNLADIYNASAFVTTMIKENTAMHGSSLHQGNKQTDSAFKILSMNES